MLELPLESTLAIVKARHFPWISSTLLRAAI
jgi:hypothetical protein